MTVVRLKCVGSGATAGYCPVCHKSHGLTGSRPMLCQSSQRLDNSGWPGLAPVQIWYGARVLAAVGHRLPASLSRIPDAFRLRLDVIFDIGTKDRGLLSGEKGLLFRGSRNFLGPWRPRVLYLKEFMQGVNSREFVPMTPNPYFVPQDKTAYLPHVARNRVVAKYKRDNNKGSGWGGW